MTGMTQHPQALCLSILAALVLWTLFLSNLNLACCSLVSLLCALYTMGVEDIFISSFV